MTLDNVQKYQIKNIINYQLKKLSTYHEINLCISNRTLSHKEKRQARKITSKRNKGDQSYNMILTSLERLELGVFIFLNIDIFVVRLLI